jgi:hypothetical protein
MVSWRPYSEGLVEFDRRAALKSMHLFACFGWRSGRCRSFVSAIARGAPPLRNRCLGYGTKHITAHKIHACLIISSSSQNETRGGRGSGHTPSCASRGRTFGLRGCGIRWLDSGLLGRQTESHPRFSEISCPVSWTGLDRPFVHGLRIASAGTSGDRNLTFGRKLLPFSRFPDFSPFETSALYPSTNTDELRHV